MVAAAKARLRATIAESYAPGDQLPNEKDLADELEMSRGTMREVLGALAADGVIVRQWGVGTFVAEPDVGVSLSMSRIESYRARLESLGHVVTLARSTCARSELTKAAAAALRVTTARGWRVNRVFEVDGTPSASMIEYLPTELLGKPLDPKPMLELDTDLFEMLDRHARGCVDRVVTDVAAIAVPAARADELGIAPGTPVIRTEQVTYSPRSEPLAYGITFQRTDVVKMRIIRG